MHKLKFIMAFLTIAYFYALPIVSAQVYEVSATGEYTMSDYEEPEIAEQRALENARQSAAEKTGVYIESYTRTHNLQVSRDEVKTIASQKLDIKSKQVSRRLDVAGNVMIQTNITAIVDTSEIDKALAEQDEKRKKTVHQYINMQQQIAEQNRQIVELKEKISRLPKDQRDANLQYEQERLDREFLSTQKLREARNIKDVEKRKVMTREAIKLNPKNDLAYVDEAELFWESNNAKQSVLSAHRATILNPNKSNMEEYAIFLAFMLEASHTTDEFYKNKELYLALNKKMTDLHPDSPLLFVERAVNSLLDYDENLSNPLKLYSCMTYKEQAIHDLLTAIKINPGGNKFMLGTGGMAVQILLNNFPKDVNWNEILHIYDEQISMSPDNEDLYDTRSGIHEILKQYDKSIVDYTNLLRINPKAMYNYFYRGQSYYDNGDYDKAINDYTRYITYLNSEYLPLDAHSKDAFIYYDSAARAYLERGNAYVQKDNYSRAIDDYAQVIAINPKNSLAYHNRGCAYIALHNYDSAIIDLQHAVALDPENERYREILQVAYDAKKKSER